MAKQPASRGQLFMDGQLGQLNKDDSVGESSSCSSVCTAGN